MTAEPQIISLGPGATDLSRQILEHQAPQYTFSFTPFLLKNYRHGVSPSRPTCKAYLQGHCPLGNVCPDRHITPNNNPNFNNLVCKHWLRGLCKKGDSCEFLHEFNLRKMPECSQFVNKGYCSNGDECLYLHPNPESRLPPCPHYEKGFCPLGPICSKKHIRKTLCPFYLAGFCPDGPKCKNSHPGFPADLAKPTVRVEKTEEEKEEEMRYIREQIEREEEAQRERWGNNDEGGSRGRGRGRWQSGFGGGRGRGQRSQRGRGHY